MSAENHLCAGFFSVQARPSRCVSGLCWDFTCAGFKIQGPSEFLTCLTRATGIEPPFMGLLTEKKSFHTSLMHLWRQVTFNKGHQRELSRFCHKDKVYGKRIRQILQTNKQTKTFPTPYGQDFSRNNYKFLLPS